MINPVWLRSFCALVEVEHFTRTANHLNMTQSGVSQHIRKLEEQLGQPLLERQGKQFVLTDAGKRSYKEGREILKALSELESQVGDDPAHEGLVRIMSPGSIGLKLYGHLLALQEKHPALVMDFRFAPNADIEQAILEHRVDVALMTTPPGSQEISALPVSTEALLLVTPKSIGEPSWHQLQQLGFIDHPDGAYHAGLLLSANYPEFHHCSQFQGKGFSNQISLILEPVSLGLGFTVLPAYAVDAFSKPHLIKIHRLRNRVRETNYLCSRIGQPVARRSRRVIDEVKACLNGSSTADRPS